MNVEIKCTFEIFVAALATSLADIRVMSNAAGKPKVSQPGDRRKCSGLFNNRACLHLTGNSCIIELAIATLQSIMQISSIFSVFFVFQRVTFKGMINQPGKLVRRDK